MHEPYFWSLLISTEQDSVHHSRQGRHTHSFLTFSLYGSKGSGGSARTTGVVEGGALLSEQLFGAEYWFIFAQVNNRSTRRRQTSLLHTWLPQDSPQLHRGVFTVVGVEANVISSYLISGRAWQHVESAVCSPESQSLQDGTCLLLLQDQQSLC